MDLATLFGILLGFALIVISITLGGDILTFADSASALIVVGGTIAATLISSKLDAVVTAIKVARNAFNLRQVDVGATINQILVLSNVARREGVLALDKQVIDDPFLARGVRMAVDGLPAEEIRETLRAELVATKQRHLAGQKLFRFMGTTSPAMGMIGTLIGLVQMLERMEDPSSIGPSMALALLTTLYGALMAYFIFIPIADKLETRTREETANMSVVIEGLEAIVKGYNALIIREKLEAHVPQADRTSSEGAAG